jgi:exopolyphosphatase/guanosine-5'-triphosphate,3'-diphosphate pyrophosphatase
MGRTDSAGDLRVNSVKRLASKFSVDALHGARVGKVALALFEQCAAGSLPEVDRHVRKLGWAAQLHEIGSHISHSDYHKHGAYILDNADAAGFSIPEMHRLSLLVLGQRGKLRKVESALLEDRGLLLQILALRLAIILCHARRDPDLTGVTLESSAQSGKQFQLVCRDGWATRYPQSAHLLREEAVAWDKTPWKLVLAGI